LLLFEFIFLRERMMDMKAGNIKQSWPTLLSTVETMDGTCFPLSDVYGSHSMFQDCCFEKIYFMRLSLDPNITIIPSHCLMDFFLFCSPAYLCGR
jgi:hypothetical protein